MHVIQANIQSNCTCDVYIGSEIIKNSAIISQQIGSSRLLIVTDCTVANLFLPVLLKALEPNSYTLITLASGEENKDWDAVNIILTALERENHDRFSTILSFGGGVVGDLSGFAASIYMRGIKWINIPTTLLAQVDASIGGKTACNYVKQKNLLGTFYQPAAVVIDTSLLVKLPNREYLSGLVEVIKYGVACDVEFFSWLEINISRLVALEQAALQDAVTRSCQIKLEIVKSDVNDHGQRRALNFGHTFAHALEAATEFKQYTHGEAVAIGMLLATQLAVKLGMVDQGIFDRVFSLISSLGLPLALNLEPNSVGVLCNFMRKDKKKHDDDLCFILPSALGTVKFVQGVRVEFIEEIIENYASIFERC